MSNSLRLKPFQEKALQTLVRPGLRHLICVSATGSGKSLIYEEHALRTRSRMLLFTPLVALGRQQAARLQAAGISTRIGTGAHPGTEWTAWILSPESLEHESTLRALEKWRPEFLVVDECHCLWDWGEDFRPAFQKIPDLPALLPMIQKTLWLTATLPARARAQLVERLQKSGSIEEQGRFVLPEQLSLSIRRVTIPNRPKHLLADLSKNPSAGIVFAGTRANAEKLNLLTQAAGIRSAHYHAGLSREERISLEGLVRDRKLQLITATSAFGMGMDFAHLSRVWLWQPPWSILELAQAVGRVGRSGRPGSATLYWDPWDFRALVRTTRSSDRRVNELLLVREYLEAHNCRRRGLIDGMEEQPGTAADACTEEQAPCDICMFLAQDRGRMNKNKDARTTALSTGFGRR